MKWIYYPEFEQFSPVHLYEVIKLRQDVFIIEQDCIYDDLDRLDMKASHLLLFEDEALAGYLRILPAGVKFDETSIGRIVIPLQKRNTGIGKQLVEKGMQMVLESGVNEIRIEAQHHLEGFYENLGFNTQSEPYDVDGIPHIEMLFKK